MSFRTGVAGIKSGGAGTAVFNYPFNLVNIRRVQLVFLKGLVGVK